MRDSDEIHYMTGLNSEEMLETVRITPTHSLAINPAFDVTPARLVTGIITERGIAKPHELNQLF
jgi:methylthioribose-1-phosphate isomerase